MHKVNFLIYFYIIIAIFICSFFIIKLNEKTVDIRDFKKDILLVPEKVELEAKSFLVYDINEKKIVLSKNENEILPLASLSKVVSLSAYLEFTKNNNLKDIDIKKKELIDKILIESSNDAMNILGKEFKFFYKKDLIEETNIFLKSKEINNMQFVNLTGLDLDKEKPSNLGSAKSIAEVYIYFYENYNFLFQDTKFDKIGKLENTNKDSDKTFGLLSSKTGFTDIAGGNLIIISSPTPDKKYILVVLGSSREGRFSDIKKLNNILPFLPKMQANP